MLRTLQFKFADAAAVKRATPSKLSRSVSHLADPIWRRNPRLSRLRPLNGAGKALELRSSSSRRNLRFKLAAPSKLSRKVLKLPGSI